MPPRQVVLGQENFLRQGGVLVHALMKKREGGELPEQGDTPFMEYPKVVRISHGFREEERSTETVDKKTRTWTERVEDFTEIVVYSEEEEARVLSGGKPNAAAEEERQVLIQRCRNMHIKVDPNWTALRLRRELGDKLDAPDPIDELTVLRDKMARLTEIALLKARITAMEKGETPPVPQSDDVDELRSQLETLGIVADKRWGVQRLRDELERATAPGEAA